MQTVSQRQRLRGTRYGVRNVSVSHIVQLDDPGRRARYASRSAVPKSDLLLEVWTVCSEKILVRVLAPDVEPLHGGGHTGLDEPLDRLGALSFNDR